MKNLNNSNNNATSNMMVYLGGYDAEMLAIKDACRKAGVKALFFLKTQVNLLIPVKKLSN